jgi:hypothetical protein
MKELYFLASKRKIPSATGGEENRCAETQLTERKRGRHIHTLDLSTLNICTTTFDFVGPKLKPRRVRLDSESHDSACERRTACRRADWSVTPASSTIVTVLTLLAQRRTRGFGEQDLEGFVTFDVGVVVNENRQVLLVTGGKRQRAGRVLEISFLRGSAIIGCIHQLKPLSSYHRCA